MSRPIKQGLDYFPMDVDTDEKIELIEAMHGVRGFAIIVKLWQKIYKDNGYFVRWNPETASLFSKQINVNINELTAVMDDCFRYQIFNKRIYARYKVLTSVQVQSEFVSAIQRRKEVNLCKNLILIDINSIINVHINWVNVDNSTQSRVK